VQGGVMTFADRTAHDGAYVSGRPTLATVQLDTHFVDSAKIARFFVETARAAPPQPDFTPRR